MVIYEDSSLAIIYLDWVASETVPFERTHSVNSTEFVMEENSKIPTLGDYNSERKEIFDQDNSQWYHADRWSNYGIVWNLHLHAVEQFICR